MSELTDEQVMRVLATYEGWTELRALPGGPFYGIPPGNYATIDFGRRPKTLCPDYLGSLDVMRRVEEKMRDSDYELFDKYIDVMFDECCELLTHPSCKARCAARVLLEAGVVKLEETT